MHQNQLFHSKFQLTKASADTAKIITEDTDAEVQMD